MSYSLADAGADFSTNTSADTCPNIFTDSGTYTDPDTFANSYSDHAGTDSSPNAEDIYRLSNVRFRTTPGYRLACFRL
jgi:hypothetical protein